MPSEPRDREGRQEMEALAELETSTPAPPRRRPYEWLFSQGLGVICGQLVVVLLGVGSVVIVATRKGDSAALRMDNLEPFFTSPSWTHLWFYLLIPVCGLYALNTTLCTWRSTVARVRAGLWSPFRHGPAFLHLSLLLALVAHLVGGLQSAEGRPVVLDSAWQELGDGREVRVMDLRYETHPNGQLRQVTAQLEVRRGGQPAERHEVYFNGPLVSDLLRRLYLLTSFEKQPGVVLQAGKQRCHLGVGGHCWIAGHRVHVVGIHPEGHWGKQPVARLVVVAPRPGPPQRVLVLPNRPHRLPDGTEIRLVGLKPNPRILLRVRHAAGVPWALAASILLVLGMVFLGRRWIR